MKHFTMHTVIAVSAINYRCADVFLCSHTHTQNGETALHLAAQEGKVDAVRVLTVAQAKINTQTEV